MATFPDMFARVACQVLETGYSSSRQANMSVRQVPGGNVSVVDIGGVGVVEIKCGLLFPHLVQYQMVEALVGQADYLIYWTESIYVVLKSISRVGHFLSGEVEAQAEFIGA